ncbi:MAG: hypothetical protein A3I66_13725 [Burkholderiales bacterium RIFCSPLOWO2_02_FULL_57_36]|nr:MAG: hypothetical protein A3I66_13725 [Burkholderiales bacterium RIFCSPLOWO2_02_FULL_57_36]
MKNFLKKYGLIGGTAAACVACCTVPIFIGPLLAWIGVTSLGLVFSPWYLLLLAVPALLMVMRKLNNQTARPNRATTGGCGCGTPTLSDERKNHGCQ